MRNIKKYQSVFFVLAILIVVSLYVNFELLVLLQALPEFFRFFFVDFLPPSFVNWQHYIDPVLETIFFAILATFISAIVSVILAFLATGKRKLLAPFRYLIKFFASVIRNIPVLVWASILVIIFGIGGLSGILSLIIFDIGFLIRSYSESIEEMDDTVLLALNASGVSPFVQVFRGKIPVFMKSFYTWTLFMFEINIRASAILGIVGAGGLGLKLKEATGVFRYHQAATIIIIMAVMILVIEFLTNKVKEAMK